MAESSGNTRVEITNLPELPKHVIRPNWNRARRVLEPFPRRSGYISVVMPTFNVEQYVREAIESVLNQDYPHIELIVVDDGSTDSTLQCVREIAKRDRRVRLLRQKNAGPNAARNRGIRRARGEYLTFLDGDDVLLPGAYQDLVDALAASASDFAVGGYHRIREGEVSPAAPWIRRVHRQTRSGATLADFPDIMVNAVQWTKLYRRTFWDQHVRAFALPGYYQDQLVSARAYSLARSFEVLDREVVGWRVRENRTSMTQQILSIDNMKDRFRTAFEALRIYHENADARVFRARLVQYLNYDFGWTIGQLVPGVEAEYWDTLRANVTRLMKLVVERRTWDRVYAQHKVVYNLIEQDRFDDVLEFLKLGGRKYRSFDWEQPGGDGDKVYVHLPFWGDPSLPEWAFVAAPIQARALHRDSVQISGTDLE